mgnify:CR=1 FL=1
MVSVWLTSFEEIMISLFEPGGDNRTITLAIFLAFSDQFDTTIVAVFTVLTVSLTGLILFLHSFGDRKI